MQPGAWRVRSRRLGTGLRRRQDGAFDQAGKLEDAEGHRVDSIDEVGGRADGAGLSLGLGCQGIRCGRRVRSRCRERAVRGPPGRAALRHTVRCVMWKAGPNVYFRLRIELRVNTAC